MYESHKAITGLMNDLVDAYFYQKQQKERLEKEKHTLGGNLRKDISRLKKKLAIQQESIRNAEEREQYRIAGDLITANIYRLQKGDTKAMLEDFHQPNTPLVTISLDPHLTPAENAQKQYKRYNKAKHTLEAAQKQAQMTNEELQYLLGIESALMLAENVEEIKQIHQEMIGQGYAKPIIIPGKKQKKVRDIPRPLAFCSSTGFPIWVGKNNRQNDYLTMKMAQDNDIWLHTKDIPGAHVIISAANGTPDETSIHEAASLAAYFSKARNSSKVPVDYTLRKYVNKPSGAKPGYVIYTDQKTIYADPQEELEETLASSESF